MPNTAVQYQHAYASKQIDDRALGLSPLSNIAETLRQVIVETKSNFALEHPNLDLQLGLICNAEAYHVYPVGSAILLKDCVSKMIELLIEERVALLKIAALSREVPISIRCVCRNQNIKIIFVDASQLGDQIAVLKNSRQWRYVNQYLKIVGGELDVCSVADEEGSYVSMRLASD